MAIWKWLALLIVASGGCKRAPQAGQFSVYHHENGVHVECAATTEDRRPRVVLFKFWTQRGTAPPEGTPWAKAEALPTGPNLRVFVQTEAGQPVELNLATLQRAHVFELGTESSRVEVLPRVLQWTIRPAAKAQGIALPE